MKTSIYITMLLIATVLMSTGCSSDNKEPEYSITPTEMEIEYGGKGLIKVSPESDGFKFNSKNAIIADVSETGKVSAGLCGETIITVANEEVGFTGQCSVKVTPTYTHFKETCLDFGCSMNDVKAFETRILIDAKVENSLGYYGEDGGVTMVMYMFSSGRLSDVVIYFPYTEYVLEDVINHLEQRFVMINAGNQYALRSPDNKIAGTLSRTSVSGNLFWRLILSPNTGQANYQKKEIAPACVDLIKAIQ